MQNLKKVGLLSAAVLVAQLILTKFLYPIIGKSTETVFAIGGNINPVSGIGGTQLGDKALGYLTGYIPLPLSMEFIWVYLAMAIGVFALIYAGMFLYEQRTIRLWQGRNLTQRIFAILLYGHVVLYALLLALKWSVPGIAVNLLIGLAVNLLLVATLVTLSASKLNFPKI
jgi:hypothetical protein